MAGRMRRGQRATAASASALKRLWLGISESRDDVPRFEAFEIDPNPLDASACVGGVELRLIAWGLDPMAIGFGMCCSGVSSWSCCVRQAVVAAR